MPGVLPGHGSEVIDANTCWESNALLGTAEVQHYSNALKVGTP